MKEKIGARSDRRGRSKALNTSSCRAFALAKRPAVHGNSERGRGDRAACVKTGEKKEGRLAR